MARVVTMAGALSAPGSPVFNDASLFASTRLALNAWFAADLINVNWWWDIVSVPQTTSLAFLLLDVLPKGGSSTFPTPLEVSNAANFSMRATWWDAALGYEVTGANLAWMVQAQLLRGRRAAAAWRLAEPAQRLSGHGRLCAPVAGWQELKLAPWIRTCGISSCAAAPTRAFRSTPVSELTIHRADTRTDTFSFNKK